ncbi:FAD-binding oxidoreductase [Paraburkholderia sediminicola]|uniref:FAD-binding oxidoreductase n=1 Tax=Paraburkholderia sediminicola TaxID=458836 RepID=UPI0038B9E0B1
MRFGVSVTHDIFVPILQIPQCLAQTEAKLVDAGLVEGARFLCVGHVGDGNIHSIVLFPHAVWAQIADRDARVDAIGKIVNGMAVRYGGSVSAERGIGRAHREEPSHYKSDVELHTMCAVKHALDPQGRMNPGKAL